jgi:NTE family protein
MAHAGVIEIIEEVGIPIDMVLGTSMGSLVGGLYAAGYSPSEMSSIVTHIDWSALFSERRDSPGDRYDHLKNRRFPFHLGIDRHGIRMGSSMLKGQNVMAYFTGLVLHSLSTRDFDLFPVPYRAVAADIITGERVVLSSGSLANAMRSSMSIPGLFEPWESDGHYLVDGGIVDNMPVDLARSMGADIVIAVESRTQPAKSIEALGSSIAISSQTIALFMEENMRPSRADADLLIKSDLSDFTMASFRDAAALIARGRKAAEAMRPQLEALASRIAESRPLVKPADQANRHAMREDPRLARLEVSGGTESDIALARTAFAPLIGTRLDGGGLKAAIDQIYLSGLFATVTFDVAPMPAGSGQPGDAVVGLLRLVPDKTIRNEILLGGSYRGVLSALASTESTLMPALYLGELTGKDSALFAEFGLLGKTLARAEYFQPFGPLYFKPGLHYESQYDSWPLGEGLGVRSYFRTVGGDLVAGLSLGKRGELEARWALESVRASNRDDPSQGGASEGAIVDGVLGLLEARIDLDEYRTGIFPELGFSFQADLRRADPAFGGTTSYTSTDLSASCALPLGPRLSLAMSGFAGTDFSGYLPGIGQLPSARWYSLRQPGMFYGLEARPDREIGNHAAALAIELRANLGRISALLGGDLFGIANLSVGSTRVTDDPLTDFLPLRFNGSLGMGARITRSFGALAVVGLVSDSNAIHPIRPALTFELGTLSRFAEDRR